MLALADWASDDGGRIYPSVETLARKIRMSERQTRRILRELENEPYLKNLTPENKGGAGQSSRYQIGVKTLTDCPDAMRNNGNNPDISDQNPDKSDQNPDIAMSDDPLDTLKPSGYPDISRSAEHVDVKLQRAFLKDLEKSPLADNKDIDAARARLSELLAIHNPQQHLIGE